MGWIRTSLLFNLIVWVRDNGAFLYCPEGLRPTAYARNHCVEAFLKSDYTHLWFIDSDTTPPIESLKLLLDADKNAISGVVPTMKRDIDGFDKPVGMVARAAVNGEYNPVVGKGIEKIDVCGSACFLIKREVFNKVSLPWFEDKSWGKSRGQDFNFCKKLEESGVDLFAHFDVICRHRKEVDL